MLHFESIFWQTDDRAQLTEKLQKLGFRFSPSTREPQAQSVYFGPESLEIIEASSELATLKRDNSNNTGVIGIALEASDLAAEYRRLQDAKINPMNVSNASFEGNDTPIWYGFGIPKEAASLIGAWIFSNSPAILEKQKAETLPLFHPNTCYGIESLCLKSGDPQAVAKHWSLLLGKNSSGLKWNEISTGEGRRFQLGERFFDIVHFNEPSNHLPDSGNVMMVTLKVTDLEKAKEMAKNAGATILPCRTRDGFVVSSQWTKGPAIRFVRAFWKRYLPVVIENYPHGRRTDQFRPLGGANSTTLQEGFDDNWKY